MLNREPQNYMEWRERYHHELHWLGCCFETYFRAKLSGISHVPPFSEYPKRLARRAMRCKRINQRMDECREYGDPLQSWRVAVSSWLTSSSPSWRKRHERGLPNGSS